MYGLYSRAAYDGARTVNRYSLVCLLVTGKPPKWLHLPLSNIHCDVLDKFYGCGYPFPTALEGCTVLDLGCGAGRDVYVLSQLVGEHGHVHGVDMTPEQLDVANKWLGWHMEKFFGSPDKVNVTFHQVGTWHT